MSKPNSKRMSKSKQKRSLFEKLTVKVSCPIRIKTAIKLFISANNFLLPRELVTVLAITLTFCNHNWRTSEEIPFRDVYRFKESS